MIWHLRGAKDGGGGGREGDGKVTRDGGPRVREDEQDRHDRGRKSDAGGGNEDGPSAGEVGGMDVGPESERARQRELIWLGRGENGEADKDEWTVMKDRKGKKLGSIPIRNNLSHILWMPHLSPARYNMNGIFGKLWQWRRKVTRPIFFSRLPNTNHAKKSFPESKFLIVSGSARAECVSVDRERARWEGIGLKPGGLCSRLLSASLNFPVFPKSV